MLPPVSIEPLELWFQVQHSPFFSDTIVVFFSFQLVQLLSVDEKSQTIKTIVWNSLVSFIFILIFRFSKNINLDID